MSVGVSRNYTNTQIVSVGWVSDRRQPAAVRPNAILRKPAAALRARAQTAVRVACFCCQVLARPGR